MIKEDQNEARNMQRIMDDMSLLEREQYRWRIAAHNHERAERMLEILNVIKVPTVENIGPKAAEIVSVFALHSYIDAMKKVLDIYVRQFKLDPNSIYKQAIPPLTDRVMIIEQRRQKFGTNWSITKDGRWFLIPVVNFANANKLRKTYGLGSMQKPRNLSIGAEEYPLGKGDAQASDQMSLTDEEYAEYTKYCVR